MRVPYRSSQGSVAGSSTSPATLDGCADPFPRATVKTTVASQACLEHVAQDNEFIWMVIIGFSAADGLWHQVFVLRAEVRPRMQGAS